MLLNAVNLRQVGSRSMEVPIASIYIDFTPSHLASFLSPPPPPRRDKLVTTHLAFSSVLSRMSLNLPTELATPREHTKAAIRHSNAI